MSKSIFYKVKPNGECYKFIPMTNEETQINAYLDMFNKLGIDYISEAEFNGKYQELMILDVFDTTNSYKIGELVTKKIEITNQEYI